MAEGRGFGLPSEPTPTPRLSVSFAGLGRRLTGKAQTVLSALAPGITPTLSVGLPDFNDVERAFYFTTGLGAQDAARFSSGGVISTREIAVYFIAVTLFQAGATVAGRIRLFTPVSGYDPFAVGPVTQPPAVAPLSNMGVGNTVGAGGRNPAQVANGCPLVAPGLGGSSLITLPSPIILPAGVALVIQANSVNTGIEATFGYREF